MIKILKRKVLLGVVLSLSLNVINAQDTTKAITFSGYIETYFLYNFNNPTNNTQPSFFYSFNRHNEVNLNLGYAKASYNKDKVRGNFALMAGTYPVANLAAEPEALRHIFEANVGVKLSAKKNLWLDAGIMPSHIGFESAIGKDCPNLTRSILAENSPYYEAGVKVGYTSKNEKWFLSALLLNGWQRIERPDGNTTQAFGTQVSYKPSSKVTLNSSTFIGNDKPDSVRQMRYFHNFYSILQLNKKWSTILGFDVGTEQSAKGSSLMNTWYSPVLIVKYAATDKLSLAARAEYYKDKKGVIINTATANGFQTTGYSANLDYAIQPNVFWRIEARSLQSQDNIFDKRNSNKVANATWLAASISVNF